MAYLTAGGVEMPCPVALKVDHEIIWSSGTGRSSTGLMVGDVVAEKKTLFVEWGVLTEEELDRIKNYMTAGFFQITFHDFGGTASITGYRSTLSAELIGTLSDGLTYWKGATVQLIQQ